MMVLMVCVVAKSMVDAVTEIIGKNTIDFQVGFPVEGTANSEMMAYLSLQPTDRQMVFSLVQQEQVKDIFKKLNAELNFLAKGSGVAFTVSLDRITKTDYQQLIHSQGGK